ncbi:hypothetical protein CONPUDRAFT_150916 [Coniophora puteana RWD-64-598 SS2]|uniref:Uncharacterized protein n=1 Tax=Coniophora puteana (strain RWD-64-598) TaxID=741705 RepID=A0A5M3MXX5_CONPW|nr:uncharacterized protein CONPUDRAFT_150916 [Coniophora puteana RWD-64-598 SS2]EIW83867.1 hypothetical protein CONPUDRAFT_150916 [Coniophora puteana RWD-64-598 SS2]
MSSQNKHAPAVPPSDRMLRVRTTKPASPIPSDATKAASAPRKRLSKAEHDAQKDADEARAALGIRRLAIVENEEQQRQKAASKPKVMPKKAPVSVKKVSSVQADVKASKPTSSKSAPPSSAAKKGSPAAVPETRVTRKERAVTRKEVGNLCQDLDVVGTSDVSATLNASGQQLATKGKAGDATDAPPPTRVQFLKQVVKWSKGVAQDSQSTSTSTSISTSFTGQKSSSSGATSVRTNISKPAPAPKPKPKPKLAKKALVNPNQEQEDVSSGVGVHTEDDVNDVAREREAIAKAVDQPLVSIAFPEPAPEPQSLKRKASTLDVVEDSEPNTTSGLDEAFWDSLGCTGEYFHEAQVVYSPTFTGPAYLADVDQEGGEGREDNEVEEWDPEAGEEMEDIEEGEGGGEEEAGAEEEAEEGEAEEEDVDSQMAEVDAEGIDNDAAPGEEEGEAPADRTTAQMNAAVSASSERVIKRRRTTAPANTDQNAQESGNSTKRRVWVLSDLPPGARDKQRWGNEFLPTIVDHVGGKDAAWNIPDADLMDAIVKAWRVVYSKPLPRTETINGAVFGLTKKKLNEWRSAFGSTAIAALVAALAQQGKWTYDLQKDFVNEQLQGEQFLNDSKTSEGKPCGMLKGEFFQLVFASHQIAIQGRAHVPDFIPTRTDVQGNPLHTPFAASVLSAAACYRALMLIRDASFGDITNALGAIDKGVTMTVSGVVRAKKAFDTVKKKEKAELAKKTHEGEEKAKDGDGDDVEEERDEEPEEPEESGDADSEASSILPFSKDHNEESTFNYSFLINRCPNERIVEALAMATKYTAPPAGSRTRLPSVSPRTSSLSLTSARTVISFFNLFLRRCWRARLFFVLGALYRLVLSFSLSSRNRTACAPVSVTHITT